MSHYRILTFDGGGIRGVYSARLLERLEQSNPGFLKRVNLLSGTSTGGIIALGLACGLTASDLVALYLTRGQEIFDDSWLDNVLDLGTIIGSQYDNRKLKKVLTETFGAKTKLGDLTKRVLIPTFDLANEKEPKPTRKWKPKFFHNYVGEDSDGHELVVEVAMYTSAAPTFFPAHKGYIDGGVAANNPSMSALAQAIDTRFGDASVGSVRLLSLGTGTNPARIEGNDLDWGLAQWAKPLVSLMIDGMMGVADYQCARLLGDRYLRISPMLPQIIDLDDWRKAGELVDLADAADLTDADAWVKRWM